MPSKPQDVFLEVKEDFIEEVLKKAGYVEWETIHLGKKKKGYIRYLPYDKRFHLYYLDGLIKLHLDKTYNKKHVVMGWMTMLNVERKRIRKIYRELTPKTEIVKGKKKKVNIYAPNLRELQRNIKQSEKIIRDRWVVRVFKSAYKLIYSK